MTRTADADGNTARSVTRYLPAAARIVLGLIFLVMGLNGFLNFVPQPATPFPAAGLAFLSALIASGYMIPLVSGTQVIVAVLLLSNRFVPLAVALIAPVIVNIFAFHAFLVPSGVVIALLVAALEVYLAWTYRSAYLPMLAARIDPSRS